MNIKIIFDEAVMSLSEQIEIIHKIQKLIEEADDSEPTDSQYKKEKSEVL